MLYCDESLQFPRNTGDPSKVVCAPQSAYDPAHVSTSYDSKRRALKLRSDSAVGDLNVPSLTRDPSPRTAFVSFLNDTPDRCDTEQIPFFGSGDCPTVF